MDSWSRSLYTMANLFLWNTQKWFPALSAVPGNLDIFSPQDLEIMSKKIGTQINKVRT